MTKDGHRKLRASLVFASDGILEDVFFMAGSDREETILRQAMAPVLKVMEGRRQIKCALMWGFNHRIMPKRVTQWIFDFFRLRSA